MVELEQLQALYEGLIEFVVNYSFQVLGALLVLLLGLYVAKVVGRTVTRLCLGKKLDTTLSGFVGNVVKSLIIVFVVIITLGNFGITVSPFIAAIGAATLGASFAIQGLLSNYAAGLTIIVSRPFKVEDTITVQGMTGQVREIKLAMTLLETEDGELISIPNKHLVGEVLVNSYQFKVVEGSIGISYDADPRQAIAVINQVLSEFAELQSAPSPQVGIEQFGDFALVLGVRYWAPTQQYFQLQYRVNLAIFEALQQAQVEIPFPRYDLHLQQPLAAKN